MRNKLQRLSTQLVYIPRALKLVWTPAPGWTIAWTVLLAIQGVLPAVTVYLTGVLVNSLVKAIALGPTVDSARVLLQPALLMGGSMILSMLIEESVGWINTAQSEVVGDYIQSLVQQKSVEADLAFYESPDYYNCLEQAQSNASSRPLELMESLGYFVQNSITAISIATILVPYGLWLPLLLVLSMTPAFFVVMHFNHRYHRWWHNTTVDRRWTGYYNSMLTSGFVAPELRLFNLGHGFQAAYQALRSNLRSQKLKILRDQAFVRLGAKAAALLIGAIALVWMLWQTILGVLTLGDLALFYQAFNRGQGLMRSLLGNVGQLYQNSLFLEHLFEFLDWQPKVVEPPNPHPAPLSLVQGIRFRQVTFRYPGSETPVLDHFDLFIPAGKTIAIVGDNGAGKSTLLKLLCRFYDPEAGAIEIDGIDIRDLSLREYQNRLTVLFQFPVRYQATAAENIAVGNPSARFNDHAIQTAAIAAGAHDFITGLPKGYDTLLSKSLAEGAELSGGEWQRVALARAFLRQSPIVVLDEPTSAMDPWAESQWLERFSTMVNERTAIVITHRFTAAMRADYIYLMQKGKIAEAGTHNELLAKGGLYAAGMGRTNSNPNKNVSCLWDELF
ncbi:ABC transporter ATP-binding protein/permease [Kovacikia minuta CCNUW1]|uniref:ABC transporter ATP-binding protein n=1 Tax=Kovacikia minuta TaxID=2931930 RepID=UPI001CCC1870|nr:ABC transporter ATP-binding protein [Kovacikia minuta]UBF26551.1 ABC transporter ATP-binding protein/permease [Kovacikia minuta CCNUW1]